MLGGAAAMGKGHSKPRRASKGHTDPAKPTYAELLAQVARLKRQKAANLRVHRQREARLHESEERFRAIADSAPDLIARFDRDLHVLYANPAMCRLVGLPEESLKGRTPREYGASASAAAHWKQAAREVFASGKARRLDNTSHYQDATQVYDIQIVPERDADGAVVAVIAIARDITERKRAYEALRASEGLYRAIGESIDYGVWVCAPDGRNTYASESFLKVVGLTQEQCSSFGWGDVLHPDDAERTIAAWKECVRTGGTWDIQHRFRGIDGQWHPVLARGVPVKDERGEIVCWAGINLDISHLTHTQEELRNAKQRLESLLENSPLAVIEWSSADFRIERWSDEATKVFGWTAEETVGRRITELDWIYPEDRHLVEQVMGDMLSGKRPRNVNKNRNVRKDGKVIHCEWYNSTLSDRAGRFSVLSLVLDVTERKQVEAALERSNQKLAEVLDSIQDDFYVLDRDWKFAFASRLFTSRIGKQPEDFLGHNIWEMFPKHLGTVYEENLRAAMDKRETRRFEVGGKYTDAWYRMTAAPSAEGITVLGTEITMNKRIEAALLDVNARLLQADARRTEFLAVLSHELRNPLAPIRNSLHILERATPGGEQARRAHAVIDRQVSHLVRLVDDLLDITRITRGKVRLQRTRLDLVALVRRTVDDHRTLLEHHKLAVALPDTAIWIDGDPTRLAQALGNLLHNAAKFTPQEGKVSVSLTVADGRALLEVADTGIGIDPETRKRLFEPFAQGDRSLDRSRGGLGLGLALVKGMVELHGGTVSAHSDNPEHGARVIIELPVEERGTATEDPTPPLAAAGRRRKVLIIEDNRDAADSLCEAIELAGHRVAVAYDGEAGLAKARELEPEIVLCDIGLPGAMDGYAVAGALRRERRTASAYLVALTGYAQPEDQHRAANAGFDVHLAKPPDLAALEHLLAQAPAHPAIAGSATLASAQ